MSTEHSFDPSEHRRAALMEGMGVSNEQADIYLGEKIISGTTELPHLPAPEHNPPKGNYVRGFHDGELRDSEVYKSEGELSPEQKLTNLIGVELGEKAIADTAIQSICDAVDEMIPIDPDNVEKSLLDRDRMKTARLKTHFEKKKARKLARDKRIADLSN